MKNFKLNAGSIVGAVLFGVIAAGIAFGMIAPNNGGPRAFRAVIVASICGAIAGNWVGGLFAKSE